MAPRAWKPESKRAYTVEIRFVKSTPEPIVARVVNIAESAYFGDLLIDRLGLWPMKVTQVTSEKYRKVFIALHRVVPLDGTKGLSVVQVPLTAVVVGLVVVGLVAWLAWRSGMVTQASRILAVIVKDETAGIEEKITQAKVKEYLTEQLSGKSVLVPLPGGGSLGVPLDLTTLAVIGLVVVVLLARK